MLTVNIIAGLKLIFFCNFRPNVCQCKGCELDNNPTVVLRNKLVVWFLQKVPVDLIANFFGAVLVTADVATDLRTGLEHWNHGNYLWAITTWTLMFVPPTISLILETISTKFSLTWERSWKKILGHMPLFQFVYHLHILKKLKEAKNEMAAQIKFYKNLDFDILPFDIKAQLMERSQKFQYAMETVSITLSNLQEQKLFEGK